MSNSSDSSTSSYMSTASTTAIQASVIAESVDRQLPPFEEEEEYEDEFPIAVGLKGPGYEPERNEDVEGVSFVQTVPDVLNKIEPQFHYVNQGRSIFITMSSFPESEFPEFIRGLIQRTIKEVPLQTHLRVGVFTPEGPYRLNPKSVRGGYPDLMSKTRYTLRSLFQSDGVMLDTPLVSVKYTEEQKKEMAEEQDREKVQKMREECESAARIGALADTIVQEYANLISSCGVYEGMQRFHHPSPDNYTQMVAQTIGTSPVFFSLEFLHFKNQETGDMKCGAIHILKISPSFQEAAFKYVSFPNVEYNTPLRERRAAYQKQIKKIFEEEPKVLKQVRTEYRQILGGIEDTERPVEMAAGNVKSMLGNAGCGIDMCIRGIFIETGAYMCLFGAGFPSHIKEHNGFSHELIGITKEFPHLGFPPPNEVSADRYLQMYLIMLQYERQVERLKKKVDKLRNSISNTAIIKVKLGFSTTTPAHEIVSIFNTRLEAFKERCARLNFVNNVFDTQDENVLRNPREPQALDELARMKEIESKSTAEYDKVPDNVYEYTDGALAKECCDKRLSVLDIVKEFLGSDSEFADAPLSPDAIDAAINAIRKQTKGLQEDCEERRRFLEQLSTGAEFADPDDLGERGRELMAQREKTQGELKDEEQKLTETENQIGEIDQDIENAEKKKKEADENYKLLENEMATLKEDIKEEAGDAILEAIVKAYPDDADFGRLKKVVEEPEKPAKKGCC